MKRRAWIQQRACFLMLAGLLGLLLAACDLTDTTAPAEVPEIVSNHVISASTPATGTPTPIKGVPTSLLPGDWSMYLGDVAHSGFNKAETVITAATAPRLKLHWVYHAKAGISDQPVEAYGMIFWGSWDGLEHATDLNGHEVWATNLGTTSGDCHSSTGIVNTATVAAVTINGVTTQAVFVGGGDDNFYALNASNGHILWKTSLGPPPAHFIWGSSVIYNGSLYIGVASLADCPTVQGQLFQINTTTGAIQHVFNAVPDGCKGGGIWSTPAIDRSTGDLYVATGNADACPTTENYAPALIELHAANLALVSYWQLPHDQWTDDSDFGSAPTLFTAKIGAVSRSLVGIAHKNGRYYVFLRGSLGNGPLWTRKVARGGGCPECGRGSISPSAWDGTTLYVAGGRTAINGIKCKGGLRALNPSTGAYLWEDCMKDGTILAPVTGVPGVLVVEEGRAFEVVDALTGKLLFFYKDSQKGSVFYGAASISHGMLYVGNFDGTLYAFGL